MKPEQIRIIIAEACGWKPGGMWNKWGDGQTYGIPPNGEPWHWCETPDYSNDLNAMKCVEDRLTDAEWDKYELALSEIVWPDAGKVATTRAKVSATAAQRAEAFVRTIGKWKEAE